MDNIKYKSLDPNSFILAAKMNFDPNFYVAKVDYSKVNQRNSVVR